MIRLAFHFLKLNFYSLIEYRISFIFQCFWMIISDVVTLVIWIFMFAKMWKIWWMNIDDFMLLYEILLIVYCLVNIFFAWWNLISRLIVSWSLDTFLLFPKNPLFLILYSRTYASLYWDILMALIIPFFIKQLSLILLLKMLYLSLLGSLTLVWMLILFESLSFYIWSSEKLSKAFFELFLWPSHYPPKIYDWTFLKILFLTFVPVYYVFFLPYELSKEFNIFWFIILHFASIFFFGAGYLLFFRWLRRYESWNMLNING